MMDVTRTIRLAEQSNQPVACCVFLRVIVKIEIFDDTGPQFTSFDEYQRGTYPSCERAHLCLGCKYRGPNDVVRVADVSACLCLSDAGFLVSTGVHYHNRTIDVLERLGQTLLAYPAMLYACVQRRTFR